MLEAFLYLDVGARNTVMCSCHKQDLSSIQGLQDAGLSQFIYVTGG